MWREGALAARVVVSRQRKCPAAVSRGGGELGDARLFTAPGRSVVREGAAGALRVSFGFSAAGEGARTSRGFGRNGAVAVPRTDLRVRLSRDPAARGRSLSLSLLAPKSVCGKGLHSEGPNFGEPREKGGDPKHTPISLPLPDHNVGVLAGFCAEPGRILCCSLAPRESGWLRVSAEETSAFFPHWSIAAALSAAARGFLRGWQSL